MKWSEWRCQESTISKESVPQSGLLRVEPVATFSYCIQRPAGSEEDEPGNGLRVPRFKIDYIIMEHGVDY